MSEMDGMSKGAGNYFRGRLLVSLIASATIASLIMAMLFIPTPSDGNLPASNSPAHLSYAVHPTISIDGNADFATKAAVESWLGDGIQGDPYIIQGYDINASFANGILIQNTNVYFVIMDCYIHDGGSSYSGIYLKNCVNGTLSDNNCSNNIDGIVLISSSNNIISHNICSSNDWDSIYLYSSSNNNTLINNDCSNNWDGVYLWSSSYNNTLINNNCSNNVYGIILEASSNNTIAWNWMSDNSEYGVYVLTGADRNTIWNNTFRSNNGAGIVYDPTHIQANDTGTNNRWNTSGTPHGYGNYWGDLTAPDANLDGIVDLSYVLTGSAGAKDYYPLSSPPENIAPITTASSSGTVGLNGWYRSNASVSLSAIDTGSGVNATLYRNGTSGSWLNYSSPFALSDDGHYMIQFYSIDNASNIESMKNIIVKIDKTAPMLTLDQSSGMTVTENRTVISWFGSDAMSGIDHFEVGIDGGSFISVGNATLHNFTTLSDGSHNITVKAVDKAGNTVEQTIQFTVDTGAGGGGGIDLFNLILVVLIIGVLAGIAIPAIFGMRRKAKESDAKAAVKDIVTATVQMIDDTKKEPGKKP